MLAAFLPRKLASWVDEVLQLVDTEDIGTAVIVHGVEDPEILELQRKLITVNLKLLATATDIVRELSQLFNHPVQ